MNGGNCMLAERMKILREQRNWSIAEAADKLMIAKSTYAGYEYGRRDVPNDLIPTIAKTYNVSADYLFGLTDNECDYKLPQIERIAIFSNEEDAEKDPAMHTFLSKIIKDVVREYEEQKKTE